jgi:ABC-type branched-subunit amino acid transport system substrate-binding protein
MILRNGPARPAFAAVARVVMLSVLAVLAVLAACTSSRPAPSPREDAAADRALRAMEQEYLLRRDAQVLALGDALLAQSPPHPNADRAASLMIDAALRLPDLDRARDLALAFPRRFPASGQRDAAMTAAARGLADGGRGGDALRVLDALAVAQGGGPARDATRGKATAIAAGLLDEDLELAAAYVSAAGVGGAVAAETTSRGVAAAPAGVSRGVFGRLGVLCPVTGRYARYGNAVQAGVRQAVRAEDPQGTGPWEVVIEDSEGDPVAAALATRRLIERDDCQVLLGALLSSTTATAALVAQQYGVPLVSPTATNERLGDLGPHVVQTNLSGGVEAEILANLAADVLRKRRFAVIRPETPEAASMAARFMEAVIGLGGEIVADQVFDPAATDFRAQVQDIRAQRPEVVFAPTSVDQMVLLGPQLDFYKVGALVLGPSEWNSTRLMERAGSVMERAVFPVSDVVFPAEWSADFRRQWPAAQYDEESTRLARSAYLAARLVIGTLAMPEAPADSAAAGDLVSRLRMGVAGRATTEEGPAAYGDIVRVVSEGRPRPFPGAQYTDAWMRRLAADSLAALADSAAVDSLGWGESPDDGSWPVNGRDR